MSSAQLRTLARQYGFTSRELTRYVELELISPPGDEMSDLTLRRVRRIRRLHRDLDINLEVVAIIMRLIDRIEELERSGAGGSTRASRVVGDEDNP